MRTLLILPFLLFLSGPLAARDPLGVFGAWGVFRDAAPARCYAIAEPDVRHDEQLRRPFVALASWPGRAAGIQFHARLRKDRARGTPAILSIGGARFPLVAGRADAWARDARVDAAIVRAMRSGQWMRVTARSTSGESFADVYALRGAATAIDAALIACARRR